jgi:hypothetical protein
MKTRDGLQGMGIQKHLLDCVKIKPLHICRGLWKKVGMVMPLFTRKLLRKVRKSSHQMQFLLHDVGFLLLAKYQSR